MSDKKECCKKEDKADYAIGGGLLTGLGAGLAVLPQSGLLFTACLISGLGLGLLITAILSSGKKN